MEELLVLAISKIIRCSNKTNIYGSCLIGGIVGSIWGDNIEINEWL